MNVAAAARAALHAASRRVALGRISWAKNHMLDPQEIYLQSTDPVAERIAHRPMHLRHASQAVRILHPRIVLPVRLTNLRA